MLQEEAIRIRGVIMEHIFYVTLFRTFSVTFQGKTITSKQIKSNRLSMLFSFMIVNHNRNILASELIDFLWNDEDMSDAAGALKNLVYRLRTYLKATFQIDDLIQTGKGAYFLNKDYAFEIDAKQFVSLSLLLDGQPESEEKLEIYKKFFAIYKGKYLQEFKEKSTVLVEEEYYHSIYLNQVLKCVAYLQEQKRYRDMEILIRKAIHLDNTEERLYEELIRSLYFQGKYKEANKMYAYTIELLLHTLNTKPSQALKELYEMIQMENVEETSELAGIQKDLIQDDMPGAFFCEYGTFRRVYIIALRILKRWDIPISLCLLTVRQTANEEDSDYLKKAVDRIQKALSCGLRKGDVVSRINHHQFVMLLINCRKEDCPLIFNRMLRKRSYSMMKKNIYLDMQVEELHPETDKEKSSAGEMVPADKKV